MIRIFIAIITLIIFSVFPIHAQKLFLTPQETFDEAKEYLLSEEPREAIPFLFELLNKGYNTATVNYYIGKCYLSIQGQKEKSISYLERALEKVSADYAGNNPDEDFSPVYTLFLLGEAYRISNEFEKSISFFKMYSDKLKEDENEQNIVKLRILECENAKDLVNAKIDVKTNEIDSRTAGINNYNPVSSADENSLFYMKGLKFYDAVMFLKRNTGEMTEPENITTKLKSDGDYIVTGISADGNNLLLYSYDPFTKGDIYNTSYVNGEWSLIEKLDDNINSNDNETHASFSSDGNTIFFTSNRKGGFGGLDIYKCEKGEDGKWKKAINMGSVINTVFNEETPFISSDNQILYFSSQGHYNMGGYDIFYSGLSDDKSWQNPVNIGYPLNTTDDDLFYFPIGKGRSGYISKYKGDVEGSSGLFRYELLGYPNPARYLVKGKIDIPSDSKIKKEDISVSFFEKQNNDTIGIKKCNSDGSFMQKLPSGNFILDFRSGNSPLDKKEFSIPAYMDLNEIIYTADLKFENIAEIIRDTFKTKNVLFDFDKFYISESDKSFLMSLSELLKKYNSLQVQVNGYSDSKGSDSYNLILSSKRASEVKNILVSFGIHSDRIASKGFGETSSVALNTKEDGSDNPEGRGYNRRVELILLNIPDELFINTDNDIPIELKVKEIDIL